MLTVKDNSNQILAKSNSELISLGREDENTVRVDQDEVSGYHGIFFKAEQLWVFRDNFSTNGSFYNGKQMRSGQIKLVKDSDIVRLANYTIKCELSKQNTMQSSVVVFKGFDFIQSFEIPEDALTLNSESLEGLEFDLNFSRNQIGALSFETPGSVVINGGAHSGTMALLDQDQIDIGDYSLLVLYGEIKTAKPQTDKNARHSNSQDSQRTSKPFVFNSGDSSTDSDGLIRGLSASSLPTTSGVTTSEQSSFRRPTGRIKTTEMSMSQKLSTIAGQEHDENQMKKHKVLAAFGFFTLILLVSFLIFASSLL